MPTDTLPIADTFRRASMPQDTLTITDNRTGHNYTLPVENGTIPPWICARSRPTRRFRLDDL